MRTIVAPTDFSSVSINALNYAADLAAAIEADLILLHVVQIPITVSEIPFTSVDYEKITEEAEHELRYFYSCFVNYVLCVWVAAIVYFIF